MSIRQSKQRYPDTERGNIALDKAIIQAQKNTKRLWGFLFFGLVCVAALAMTGIFAPEAGALLVILGISGVSFIGAGLFFDHLNRKEMERLKSIQTDRILVNFGQIDAVKVENLYGTESYLSRQPSKSSSPYSQLGQKMKDGLEKIAECERSNNKGIDTTHPLTVTAKRRQPMQTLA